MWRPIKFYTEPPSKQNPLGVTTEELRIKGEKAGAGFRRIVDHAKSARDVRNGAEQMFARGYMAIPEFNILCGIEELNQRLAKEMKMRIIAAKDSVGKHIKSSARLNRVARNATRNHVRGWA